MSTVNYDQDYEEDTVAFGLSFEHSVNDVFVIIEQTDVDNTSPQEDWKQLPIWFAYLRSECQYGTDTLENWFKLNADYSGKDELFKFVSDIVKEHVKDWDPWEVVIQAISPTSLSITVYRIDNTFYLLGTPYLLPQCPKFNPLDEKESYIRVMKWYLKSIEFSFLPQKIINITNMFNFITSHLEVLNRPDFKQLKIVLLERVATFKQHDSHKFQDGFLDNFMNKLKLCISIHKIENL